MSPQTAARRQWAFVALFLVVVACFVTMFRMAVVSGNSMEPTFVNGQVVLVRKRNLLNSGLKDGDVVLVQRERDVIIKRVYRMPGEEVTEQFPNVLRFSEMNGLLDYYEQQTIPMPGGGTRTRYSAPEGYIVVLGDNLRVSEDSRAFGPVPIRDVIGSVVNAPAAPYASASRQPLRFGAPAGGY